MPPASSMPTTVYRTGVFLPRSVWAALPSLVIIAAWPTPMPTVSTTSIGSASGRSLGSRACITSNFVACIVGCFAFEIAWPTTNARCMSDDPQAVDHRAAALPGERQRRGDAFARRGRDAVGQKPFAAEAEARHAGTVFDE